MVSVPLLVAAAGPARAQFAFEEAILPPRAVAWRLVDRGFTPLGRPRFDGRTYVVDAMSPAGARVRLFVDPADGVVVGRQDLDPPMVAYNRPPGRPLGRPSAPGYGWTEDDARPPVPPAEIPSAGRSSLGLRTRSVPNPPSSAIDGVNPDVGVKPEAPRRSARLSGPEKPRPVVRTAPAAPKPVLPEQGQIGAADKPEAASVAPPVPAEGAPPATPGPNPVTTAAAAPPQTGKANEAIWKDPPSDGPRKVRVIGGATMVPGVPDKDVAPGH